jgi:hypothetical protein
VPAAAAMVSSIFSASISSPACVSLYKTERLGQRIGEMGDFLAHLADRAKPTAKLYFGFGDIASQPLKQTGLETLKRVEGGQFVAIERR